MKKMSIALSFLMLLVAVFYSPHVWAQKPVVMIISTGGSIAMAIDPVTKKARPAISGEELVSRVPQIEEFAKLEVANPFNIPSDWMDSGKWVALQKSVLQALERPDVAGVVVTHGTDTLEETAYFLDLTIKSEKPVVLIGSQRASSAFDFDGSRNLLDAVRICVTPEAKNKGVMLCMNGQINAAREVTKTHTYRVDTFKSGEYGYLGTADEDRIRFHRLPARRQYFSILEGKEIPSVTIITQMTDTGESASLLSHAIEQGAKGAVIQAFGGGIVNIPMWQTILKVIEKDIPVVIASRVLWGPVVPNSYNFLDGGGIKLREAGAIFADDLKPWKARILLMLLLHNDIKEPAEIQKYFFNK